MIYFHAYVYYTRGSSLKSHKCSTVTRMAPGSLDGVLAADGVLLAAQ